MADAVNDFLAAMSEFAPRLAGAVAVLLATLLVALLLQRLAARLLEVIGLDALFERAGVSDSLWRLGYGGGPSRLLGLVVFWGAVVTGIAASLSVLGISSLQHAMDQIVDLFGRTLVALLIMMGGVTAAGWLAGLVARESERAGLRGPEVFRRVVFAAVVSVAALVAASQLGLETSLIVVLATVVLAAAGLAAALALGQGLAPLSGNIAAGRYVQDGTELGDVISVDGIEGTVEELGYASVTLRSEDGHLYRIPNRTLLESVVRKQA